MDKNMKTWIMPLAALIVGFFVGVFISDSGIIGQGLSVIDDSTHYKKDKDGVCWSCEYCWDTATQSAKECNCRKYTNQSACPVGIKTYDDPAEAST